MHILSDSFTDFSGVDSAHRSPSLKKKNLLMCSYALEIINIEVSGTPVTYTRCLRAKAQLSRER